MKRRTVAVGAAVLVVSLAVSALAYLQRNEPDEAADGVRHLTLRSRILHEDRELIVHLPASYDREPRQRYPVLYVLDGSSQDGHTAYSAALLARIGVMPELIVVGIPNTGGKGRERDYTPPFLAQDAEDPRGPRGGGDRFLAFLKTELLPHIERHYRTQPFRLLAGHSRGGLLAVYALMAEPGLFQATFAHSPALWRDDTIVAAKLSEHFAAHPNQEGFLYLSLGDGENEKMTAAFRRVVSVLKSQAPSSLRWEAQVTLGANHHNNAELATPVGLHSLYRDCPARGLRSE